MRKYEELTVKIADITAGGLAAVLTKEVIMALEPQLVGEQLLGKDTILVGKAGLERRFRKVSAIPTSAWATRAEGVDFASFGDQTYTFVTTSPIQYAVSEDISGEALEVEDFNSLEVTKESLARAAARGIDKLIWDGILDTRKTKEERTVAAVPAGATTVATFANWTLGCLLKIVSATTDANTAIISYDYYKGKVELKNVSTATATVRATVEYLYSGRAATCKVDAFVKGKYSLEDLQAAKLKIINAYGKPDSCVTFEDEVADLLLDSRVIANQAFDKQVLEKGKVTNLYGLDLLSSQMMYPGVAVVVQKGSAMGYKVYKIPLKVITERLPRRNGDIMVTLLEQSSIAIVNDNLIAIVTNCQSDAKAL